MITGFQSYVLENWYLLTKMKALWNLFYCLYYCMNVYELIEIVVLIMPQTFSIVSYQLTISYTVMPVFSCNVWISDLDNA